MARKDQSNKRSDSIRIRLSPEMMKRFEKLSADFGMAPSTLAAFAVADFVIAHEYSELRPRSLMHVVERVSKDDDF